MRLYLTLIVVAILAVATAQNLDTVTNHLAIEANAVLVDCPFTQEEVSSPTTCMEIDYEPDLTRLTLDSAMLAFDRVSAWKRISSEGLATSWETGFLYEGILYGVLIMAANDSESVTSVYVGMLGPDPLGE